MNTNNYFAKTETPCIGICSTIYGDEICRGCFRTYQDIIDWNIYPDTTKLAILDSLNAQAVAILKERIEIINLELLKAKCNQFKVKIRPTWDPLTWAHALLREGIHQIQDLHKYGIQIKPDYARMRLPKFIELIDDEIFHVAHRPL